ncbi:L,D-transpeptidase family protein [Chelativorans sp. AA-79]|uniref:L,D-transpeptidase family protein n=1 Tax=Chelativorans sp. AA-79 TaxID=3028735 RepID=UPI0023F7870C|nr:L,D-transpeptidase family protein [Chelativorans sp. AA-79]WEX09847.1 L,D-transpeptidase family protein [Chelativorans sp. AA-79]
MNKSIIRQKKRQGTPASDRRPKAPVLKVSTRPGDRSRGLLAIGGLVFACALGRSGVSAFKREGDGATPLATMRPQRIYFRPDRRSGGIGPARLPVLPIRPDLGWCDAPCNANYNRPVRLPIAASHERMLRQDRLYDVCVVLDWNIRPRKRGAGSAIFLHIAREGMMPTEGCIAVSPRDMARLLRFLSRRTRIAVLS